MSSVETFLRNAIKSCNRKVNYINGYHQLKRNQTRTKYGLGKTAKDYEVRDFTVDNYVALGNSFVVLQTLLFNTNILYTQFSNNNFQPI